MAPKYPALQVLTLLRVAALAQVTLRGAPQISEDQYLSYADASFTQRCLLKWQEDCRRSYRHDEELRSRLCDGDLDRNYIKIRLLVPTQDILDRWALERERRDFDAHFFRTQLPRFTDTGFKMAKLPADLHQTMHAWFQRHRLNNRPESSEPVFAFNCNTGYDSDDWIVPLNPEMGAEDQAFQHIKEYIRQQLVLWTGQDVNELTGLYGVRQYHRGSVCGMHTDDTQTRAFSAVYQLDQRGMDQPWGLDYVSHAGEEGRAYLQPGELLLYESATGLHGRKEPLRGDEFSNIFFHFRSPAWQPEVQKRLQERYWPMREKHEHDRGKGLYQRPTPKSRLWSSRDECLPIRSREAPLLPEGGFMETPRPEEPHRADDRLFSHRENL